MEDLVLQNLFNGGTEARIQAARELVKPSGRQRRNVFASAVIYSLISMLQSQDCEAIEAALSALISLTCGSERNKIRAVTSGAIPVLLELLQCPDGLLIELTLAAFLVISSCAANKVEIMSSGGIPLIVETLSRDYANVNDTSSLSIQAKLDAIATLHNLSTCDQIIPSIVSSGVVFELLQLIHSYERSSELVEKAMALLENIVYSSENALLQAANAGGAILVLVEMIEDGSQQCKEHAVGILLLICQNCRDKYRELILREGVMPGLLQLSVDGTRRAKEMARDLLLLLRDCTSYGSRGRQSKHDLLQRIMQEIDIEAERDVGSTTLSGLLEEFVAMLRT